MADYQNLPDESRVWIYQSGRPFTKTEQAEIRQLADGFLSEWNSHGSKLTGAIEVFYDLFIVVMADQVAVEASGCSIDASFQFIKGLEQRMGVNLLDRLTIAYRNGDGIRLSRIDDFEELIRKGEVNGETVVFNNLVDNLADFNSKWEVLLKDSWHRKLLK